MVFLFALLLHFRWRYWLGALCGGLVVLFLPALWVGWTHNINMHIAWVKVVFENFNQEHVLDMASAFGRVGLPTIGMVLNKIVFFVTLVVFPVYAFLGGTAAQAFPKGAPKVGIDWIPWITFGVSAMLLTSPRTEMYTFVMLAPSYLLMFYWCWKSERRFARYAGTMAVAILAVTGASMRYIDRPWWVNENPIEIMRVLGALGFWILSGTALVSQIIDATREWRTSRAGVPAPA
jgi:hypothetical protein